MFSVPRETSRFLSTAKLLKLFESTLEGAFSFQSGSVPFFTNIHSSLLPFLLLWFSRLKSVRSIVSINNFTLRQKLFEALSKIEPDSCYNISRSSYEGLTSADHHAINSFARGRGSFLLVSPGVVNSVATAMKNNVEDSVFLSSIKNRSEFIGLLDSWGLDCVRRVDSPGTYAVRGSIVDFFLMGYLMPIRLEFYGEKIESARSFNVGTQKMVEVLELVDVKLVPPVKISKTLDKVMGVKVKSLSVFSLESTGVTNIFDLSPVVQPFCGPFDLACVDHPSFIGNRFVLKQLLGKYSNPLFSCVLFCSDVHNSTVKKDPFFNPFLVSNLPFNISFSSSVLKFFWVSLYSVYEIQERPVSVSIPIKRAKPPSSLSVFPWKGPVVHENLGVGLYMGLSAVSKNNVLRECVALEFKHGDLVHVPLDSLSLITNYVSNEKSVPLSDLRSGRWSKIKKRAIEAAGKTLDRFIEIYGKRDRVDGFAFSPNSFQMDQLVESFPYSETKDQIKCLEDVQKDMESKKPMDRLVCGDVGVGKTEIAIRAAYKAITDGKQVLLFAPTTILATQLFNSFSQRLSPLGVEVLGFSRLTNKNELKKVLSALKLGVVCVVVGTHRLLSQVIRFSKLGLVIIDEEHRFGAKQKEFLRDFCSGADVLSMSATPIPRTLQFSLSGIRDISRIKTPPPGRLPIITSVEEFSFNFIKRAVLYEVGRGGQIFFVNSNISEIPKLKSRLENLLPDIKIGLAHGRLSAKELESVMLKMVGGELDMLISTTIIEAGIDLPRVNTIFINNAHRYGLAQLYQMRGRVGRSAIQAYCYLVLPKSDVGGNAKERLRTIQYNVELGSGFSVAMRDLEMRGSGNLFGVEQSGHLASIGFHLYTKIVQEAAKKRFENKNGGGLSENKEIGVSVVGDALIPSNYIQDQDDRLYFYQLLATSTKTECVVAVEEEMLDRFGPLPKEVLRLLSIKRIRLASVGFCVDFVEVTNNGSTIWFIKNSNLVSSIGRLLGSISTKNIPFSIINGPKGRGGLFLPLNLITESLLTIEYTFESSVSSV